MSGPVPGVPTRRQVVRARRWRMGGRRQSLRARRARHGGYLARLKRNTECRSRGEARAIEEQIRLANPHFENKIASISRRHRWYGPALEWARKYMRLRGIQRRYR